MLLREFMLRAFMKSADFLFQPALAQTFEPFRRSLV